MGEETFSEHAKEPGCNCCGGHRQQKQGRSVTHSPNFRRRIEAFLFFVWRCQWNTIAVVGHSLWFRCRMGLAASESSTISIGNACVWKLSMAAPVEPGRPPQIRQWEEVIAPDE